MFLFGNNLEGTIPTEIGTITSLDWLMLEENLFTGTIPNVFNQMINLDTLYLDDNLLTGTIIIVVMTYPSPLKMFRLVETV